MQALACIFTRMGHTIFNTMHQCPKAVASVRSIIEAASLIKLVVQG